MICVLKVKTPGHTIASEAVVSGVEQGEQCASLPKRPCDGLKLY